MDKWEYTVICESVSSLQEKLNWYGERGWEVVTMAFSGGAHVILKRKK